MHAAYVVSLLPGIAMLAHRYVQNPRCPLAVGSELFPLSPPHPPSPPHQLALGTAIKQGPPTCSECRVKPGALPVLGLVCPGSAARHVFLKRGVQY